MLSPVIAKPLAPRSPLPDVSVRAQSALAHALDAIAFAALACMVFAIPVEDLFPLFAGRTVSQWIGLLAVVSALLRTLSLGRIRRPLLLHVLLLLFTLWSALSALWSLAPASTLSLTTTYLQLLLLTWLVWDLSTSAARVAILLQAYVLASLVSAGEICWNAFAGRDASVLYSEIYGLAGSPADRYTAGGFNLNDLGLLLALGIPMSVYLLSNPQRMALRVLSWLHLALVPIAILLTASRGASIALAVSLYAVVLALPFWSAARRWLCAGIGLLGAFVAAYAIPQGVWSRLLETSDQFRRWDLSERASIWSAAFELFRSHPFAGIGAAAFPDAVAPALGSAQVAHNTFVSVLTELGVVGIFLLALILIVWGFSALRLPPFEKRLWLTMLATWCVGVCSLTWEYRKSTWLILALAAAHFGVDRRRVRKP